MRYNVILHNDVPYNVILYNVTIYFLRYRRTIPPHRFPIVALVKQKNSLIPFLSFSMRRSLAAYVSTLNNKKGQAPDIRNKALFAIAR